MWMLVLLSKSFLPAMICRLIAAFSGTTGSHVHGIPCAWESGRKRRAVAKMKPMGHVNPRIFWGTKSLLKWVRPSESCVPLSCFPSFSPPIASSPERGRGRQFWACVFFFPLQLSFFFFFCSIHFSRIFACKIKMQPLFFVFFFLASHTQVSNLH